MKIRDWLGRLAYTLVQGSLDEDVEDVVYDSRKARPHTVFVCIRGSARDSHTFIPDVLEKGCRVPGDRKGCDGTRGCDGAPGGKRTSGLASFPQPDSAIRPKSW